MCIHILRQETFPWSLGNVPKEFVNVDHGNDSHGVREGIFLLQTMGNVPMTCDNAIVIEPQVLALHEILYMYIVQTYNTRLSKMYG